MHHQCTRHQDTLDRWSMIDFIVVSSDLQPYFLNTWVKKGAELSTVHHLVVSWIRGMDRPKYIVRFCCEHLAEPSVREVFDSDCQKSFSQISREAEDIVSEWTCSKPPMLMRQLGAAEERSLVQVVATIPKSSNRHRK